MLTPVLDLEPVSTPIIIFSRARGLRHVERDWALVVDRRVEGESKGAPSLDGGCARGSTVSTDVASQVVRSQIGHGRIVVAVLTDVLEDWVLGTANAQLLEDVVSCYTLSSKQRHHHSFEVLHDRQ